MKKRIAVVLLASMMCSVSACGKTETEKAVEAYEEMGMTKEEAQEVAEFMEDIGAIPDDGKDSDETNEDEKEQEAEETDEEKWAKRMETFQLVEMREEIENSDWTDSFIQLENEIIPIDGTLSLREVVELVQSCYDFPITAYIDGVEVTEDSLLEKSKAICQVNLLDDLGNYMFSLECRVSSEDEYSKLLDCKIFEMMPRNELYILNFFVPGNLRLGGKPDSETEQRTIFEERAAQRPVMTYSEVLNYLDEEGIEYKEVVGTDRSFYGPSFHVTAMMDRYHEGIDGINGPLEKADDGEVCKVRDVYLQYDEAQGIFTAISYNTRYAKVADCQNYYTGHKE